MKQKLRRWQVWLVDKEVLKRDFNTYLQNEIIRKIVPNQRLVRIHLNKAFHQTMLLKHQQLLIMSCHDLLRNQ